MEALITALIPGLLKLLETALADDYDQEAEYQAILKLQRAIADERMRRAVPPI